jgi:putative tricarboxylic transport membrane protein
MAVVMGTAAALSACGQTSTGGGQDTAAYPSKDLAVMAPGSAGGGWDRRARSIQQALTSCKVIDNNVTVTNVPGAAGTIGLAKFVQREGNPYELMVMDTSTMLGGIITNKSPVALEKLTPIAGLTISSQAVVVPANSPIKDINELMTKFKEDPAKTSWVGGSAGGTDHLLVARLAKAHGVALPDVNYVATAGGGEVLSNLLSGAATAGVSTVTEVSGPAQAGQVRILAVSGAKRLDGIDAPTLTEAGVKLEDMNSVGGIMAPPGLSEDQQKAVVNMIDKMRATDCWKKALQQNSWQETWLPGSEFGERIAVDSTRMREILTELGLVK